MICFIRENMKKTLLLSVTLLLLLACETGVKNQKQIRESVPSGIVERSNSSHTYASKTSKYNFPKIFSRSAQPGFYLQMALFTKYRPSKTFLRPLERSHFNYIVLNKFHKDYVLIGPYKSYASAKSHIGSVKRSLGKQTFVVQVLRP